LDAADSALGCRRQDRDYDVPDRIGDIQDADLLDRFHAGDADAFALLLQRYERPIYNFLLRSVRDRSAAEDLTQDVFMRVVSSSQGFNRASKFSTWLYTIARHACIDHARRMKHRRHASLDGPGPETDDGPGARLVDRIAHDGPGVDRHADSEQMRERIARAIEALPDEQREVFLMRHMEGLPFAEIASICEVPENTVKSRMRYALERLQSTLGDYEDHLQALGSAS
jgi:RNA polymerase sigma-70 factor, ECF subfamily